MRNILAFAFLFILLISIAGASQDAYLPPLQKATCATLSQTCSNCTFVNVTTVKFPNQSIQVLNRAMTQSGANYYNYTFCNTNYNGELLYTTLQNPDGNLDSQTTHIPITPNGELPTVAKAIFYIGLLTLLVFFTCLIFWAHMQDQSHLAKFWWFSFMWIPFWAILFIGWSMARDFLTSQGVIEAVLYYGWIVIGIIYPFYILGLVIYTFYWIYEQREVQKLVKRGFSLEDAQARSGGRGRGMS